MFMYVYVTVSISRGTFQEVPHSPPLIEERIITEIKVENLIDCYNYYLINILLKKYTRTCRRPIITRDLPQPRFRNTLYPQRAPCNPIQTFRKQILKFFPSHRNRRHWFFYLHNSFPRWKDSAPPGGPPFSHKGWRLDTYALWWGAWFMEQIPDRFSITETGH